jgi:muramoyltetrapeptide carboxypeptidase
MRRPTIGAGARVALVAPGGPLNGEDDARRAEDNTRALGWQPLRGSHVLACDGYLAGSDGDRLADLNGALTDDDVDAVWCLRGGYGAMRILNNIDYAALRRRPKPLIGYSDVTALHSAISTRCEVISYHGPTARTELTPFSHMSLQHALQGEESCGFADNASTLRSGRARGRLVGGNLALLSALGGTPYEPNYHDAILVLEDVNEAVYRIDRMLTQLRLAGRLGQCRGIVFGQFTDVPDSAADGNRRMRTFDDVFREIINSLEIPSIAGAPIGHVADQWTVPLGAIAELDADARTLRILE